MKILYIATDQNNPPNEPLVDYQNDCLEKIESQFQQKDFSLRFEALLTAEQKLKHYFSLQDEMALFSFFQVIWVLLPAKSNTASVWSSFHT